MKQAEEEKIKEEKEIKQKSKEKEYFENMRSDNINNVFTSHKSIKKL